MLKDSGRYEEHIRDYVIKSKACKGECRPPDRNNLGEVLSRGEGQETSETDKPVRANTTQEDLVPMWCLRNVSLVHSTSTSRQCSHTIAFAFAKFCASVW